LLSDRKVLRHSLAKRFSVYIPPILHPELRVWLQDAYQE